MRTLQAAQASGTCSLMAPQLVNEAVLQRLTGIPFFTVDAGKLPRTVGMDAEPAANDVRVNAAALRRIVTARIQQTNKGHALKLLSTDDYRRMLEGEPYALELIYTEGLPQKQLHRLKGTHAPEAALLLESKFTSSRALLHHYLHCPAELIENTWPQHKRELEDLARLHEATHALQLYSPKLAPYKHELERAFYRELDADNGALDMGEASGISARACALMRDARSMQAFTSAAKHYWFSPQLNGISTNFAATIAAHRELRAVVMFTLDGRDMPDTRLMRKWAKAHDGETLVCRDSDVLNLRRRINRLADKLDERSDTTKASLQALAQLNGRHEFALPLAQKLTAITVSAARSFMPKLMA